MKTISELKHIYYFSFYGLASPSTRYRGKYVLDYFLEKHNISYSFSYPGNNFKTIWSFLTSYLQVLLFRKKDSLIIIQKVYTNGIYARLLKLLVFLRKSKTVYDIDDAEYLRFPDKTMKYFLHNCAAVYVGSNALLNYALQFNQNTHLLTSPVTTSSKIKSQRNKLLTIGWIGDYGTGKEISKAFSHKTSLKKLLLPALRDIDIPLKVILAGIHSEEDCDEILEYLSENKNLQIELPRNINWFNEDHVHIVMSQFDIGLSPMVDHEFNKAKSAFKIKQYFSCGIPALASPVGENNTFIQEGLNGFFCSTPKDFKEKICLINSMNNMEYEKLSGNAIGNISEFNMDYFCNNVLKLYLNS